ncbi:hypothetical protein HF086_015254 [Spodoptera exigua]|uniref:Ig-like domain-containing protein n=1 Tax=Spodoptera exigua TaxID=7107 RepID=A0A922SF59_SPOEX|nr:hypothetical protein HF086_015254 [Spodoptera exigua]
MYSSISWWRRGASVALGGAGRVSARGAELRLAPALPADAGHYACAVAAPTGPAARRDVDIQVRNPPKISPFMFSSELTEGSSVQVLCGVSSGDKPMYFTWLKDGAPLPANLQIEEKNLNEFSLLMFSELTARHSGEYTCRVSNHAAVVNYTATLSVKVAPTWTMEPSDTAVLLGAPLLLRCAAKGHPVPLITWYRRSGGASSLVGDSGDNGEQWEQVGSAEWGAPGGLHAVNGSLAAGAAARGLQGLYRCLADNGVGPPLLKHEHFDDDVTLSLVCHCAPVLYSHTEPPAAPRQLRLGGVGSRWVRLVWTAPPAPPAPPASLVYTALYAPLRTPGAATATNLTVHTDHRYTAQTVPVSR